MDDQRLQRMIGNLLRIGVLTAAGVVTIGGVVYLLQNMHGHADYRHYLIEPESATTVQGILRSAAEFHSDGLIQLGILLLIATPVARVVLAVAGFALEGDWLYVAVSMIVLAVLFASLMHAT
jgi:uncharacterized membrane protein